MRKTATLLAVILGSSAPALAVDLSRITINGYTSLEIEKQIEGEGDGNGDTNGSFDADLFDLVLNVQVTDKIRGAADFTWEHGAATEDGRGNVALEYGFVEYAFSDLFKLRFGKMFIPFGAYNDIHTAKPAFLSVKEPSSTNKTERIVEDAFRFFPRWGAGIAVQGGTVLGSTYLDYNLMVSNGEQENTNPFEEDDNKSKAFTARLRLEPSTHLRLGGSFYSDTQDSETLDTLRSEGVEIELFIGRLEVQAEAAFGNQSFKEADDVQQIGWYVQPSFRLSGGVTPYARFEWIDPNVDGDEDEGIAFVAGLNVSIEEWFIVKIENNYFKGSDQSSLSQFPGSDYNEIKAAVVLGF